MTRPPDAPSSPLRAQRDELARRLQDRLAEQAPLPELQDMQARLQLIDQALAVPTAPRKPGMRRHVMAMLAVAALVSVAAWWPVPRTAFSLELEADAAQLQMKDAGNLAGDVVDGELRAEGFDAVESPDAALVRRARDEGAGQLGLQAQTLRLRSIGFPAGARLGFEAGADSVRLSVDGAPHAVELEVAGAVSSSFGGAPREPGRYAVAEWMKLVSKAAPTEVWLARAGGHDFAWRGLQPTSLRFVLRQAGADGPARVVSALRGGTLHLPATERDVALAVGATLELDGLRLDQTELMLGDKLTLKLNGSAERMTMAAGGFEHSLKPSLLEYLAHNHMLSMLWSAAGLLWGISTWLRKAFGDEA